MLFWHDFFFHRILVNTLTAAHILKIVKNLKKNSEFINILVMFGRIPNITNGNFSEAISLKFNAKSNTHVHSAEKRKERAQNGDSLRYGEIHTLLRINS